MTNEEFDKRLSEHINQVFDDIEHAGANDGWLLLREKYPPKDEKKPIAWFWWGTAAAILLCGIAAGLWLNKRKQVAVVQSKINNIKSIPAKANNDSALQRIDRSAGTNSIVSDRILNHKAISKGADISKTAPAIASNTTSRKRITHATKHASSNNSKQINIAFADKNNRAPSQNIPQQNDHRNTMTDSTQTTANALPAKTSTKATDTTTKQETKPVIAVAKLIRTDSTKRALKAISNKKVVFGVFASAFYNYAANSNTLFNFGGGATVDFTLTRNLKLATGIGVMRNDLYYTRPPGSGSMVAATTNSSSITTTTPTTAFKYYQANLLAIDVPINLKYQLGSSHNFISAGFSSQTYIRQQYTQVNSYTSIISTANSLPNTIDVTSTTKNGFGRLDIAKTLNLSFGLGYRISSKSVLVFEPFLKAPLSSLGSQNLKYGSYGLNLKINFEPKP